MRKFLLLFMLPMVAFAANGQPDEKQSYLDHLMKDDKMLNIMLDTRLDGLYTTGDGTDTELGFRANALKLVAAGEIVPGIRYYLRHRLNRPQNPLERDNLSGATDHAWVAFDLGRKKDWTILVGKQSVQFGTFEYDYNPADIYLGSMAFNDLDSYKTGVNVAYRFLGQTVNLQVVNSDAPQFAGEEYRKKALALHVLWEGSLWDGRMKTRWAYGAFQHTKRKIYNWVTAGIQLNISNFTSELDYYYGVRNMDISGTVGYEDPETIYARDHSASLNLKYNNGKWRPFVKGTFNHRYDKEVKKDAYRNFGIQGGLEFYPFRHKLVESLRFHLVYAYNETEFKGNYAALAGKDEHMVILGMRWLFKVK